MDGMNSRRFHAEPGHQWEDNRKNKVPIRKCFWYDKKFEEYLPKVHKFGLVDTLLFASCRSIFTLEYLEMRCNMVFCFYYNGLINTHISTILDSSNSCWKYKWIKNTIADCCDGTGSGSGGGGDGTNLLKHNLNFLKSGS